MSKTSWVLTSLALVLSSAIAGPAAAKTCAALTDANWVGRFQRGGTDARMQTVSDLRLMMANATSPPSTELPCLTSNLRAYYGFRAGRQQTFLDAGTTITGFGGVGASLSGGAGAHTQAIWGYGALLPVFISRFNAHEPTRDLYHGVGEGLDLVTVRYAIVRSATERLKTTVAALGWSVSPAATRLAADQTTGGCDGIDAQIAAVEGWAAGEARAGLLADALAARASCAKLREGRTQLDRFLAEATARQTKLHQAEASDAVRLDNLVRRRDDQLRYTPMNTFQALAAAPFETAGALLSGEDGRKALDNLKTQAAFTGLNMRLSELPTISLPEALPAASDLKRPNATGATARQLADRAAVSRGIASAIDEVNDRRIGLNDAIAIAREIAQAAALDRLGFSYDPATADVTVSLSGPPAPTTTLTAALSGT